MHSGTFNWLQAGLWQSWSEPHLEGDGGVLNRAEVQRERENHLWAARCSDFQLSNSLFVPTPPRPPILPKS